MRTLVPLTLSLLAFGPCLAQGVLPVEPVENIFMHGTVSEPLDVELKTPVDRGTVTVTDATDPSFTRTSPIKGDGKYELHLPYDRLYRVVYEAPGMVTRHVLVDARNVPAEGQFGGQGMEINMTLVRRLPDLDYSLFDRPGSTARYDDSTTTLTWDLTELDRTRTALNAFLEKYYAAKDGRK